MIAVQMTDKVWAEEPGVTVTAKYADDGGTVLLQIIKDGEPVATATLALWRWQRLHKIER